jgi:galactokinase
LQVATSVATKITATLVDSKDADDAVILKSSEFGTEIIPFGPLREAVSAGSYASIDLKQIQTYLKELGKPFWVFYVFGSISTFVKESGWLPALNKTLTLVISSDVPTSQGVSSSASVEVATIRALLGVSNVSMSQLRLAHIAQAAENFVVGAPCGLMDQLASALGAPGKVLPILCRPDIISAPISLPESVCVVGWPSGVKHSVGASPYLTARTATFMGKKIVEKILGRTFKFASEISPSTFFNVVASSMPSHISGSDFLAQYAGVDDLLSKIDPDTVYAVKDSVRFPIEETFRTGVAASLLRSLEKSTINSDEYKTLLTQVGELMMQTHAGYTAIGLGSHATDEMVLKLAELGPTSGIYGARISGGGSGGTVAVLCEKTAIPTLLEIANKLTFGTPFTGLIQ